MRSVAFFIVLLSVVMLIVIMLSVVLLNVVMLIVVEPLEWTSLLQNRSLKSDV
jgi:hypothetical protein